MKNKSIALGIGCLMVTASALVTISVCGKPIPTPRSLATTPSMTAGKWVASDLPYKDVESEMAKDFAKGQTPQAISQKWQTLASSQPKDPVAQFAAVIAARGAYREANPDAALPYALVETLAAHDPGNVHEYARMRFCMLEEADRPLPPNEAKAVGDKLLQYNPKDTLVRTNLIYMLCDANHAQTATPYALEWVKADPNNAKAHSSLGEAYFDCWEASGRRNKAVGNRAISEYQTYLRLAPSHDVFRPHALVFIKHIRQYGAQ